MKNAKKTENKAAQPSPDKVFEPADYDKLREAIVALDPADDSRWNQAGGPNMNYLKEFMGRVVTADHIKQCGAGKWTREVAFEMADKKAAEASDAAEKAGGENGGGEGVAGTAMGIIDPNSTVAGGNGVAGTAFGPQDPDSTVVKNGDKAMAIDDGVVEVELVGGPAETELERQTREREEARATRLENEATGANIHDERSLKVREQAKAAQALDKKKAKKEKQQAEDDAVAEEKRKVAHSERVAVEPSMGEFADQEDAEARFDNLERVTMTLVKVLLDMPLSPVLRSKVIGCDKLIRNLSDED